MNFVKLREFFQNKIYRFKEISPSKETTDMDEEIQDDVIIAAKERLRDAMSRKTMFGITVAVKKLEALVGSKDPDVREGRCMIELFEIGEEEEELKHRGDRRVRKTNELPSPVVSVATSTTSLSFLFTRIITFYSTHPHYTNQHT